MIFNLGPSFGGGQAKKYITSSITLLGGSLKGKVGEKDDMWGLFGDIPVDQVEKNKIFGVLGHCLQWLDPCCSKQYSKSWQSNGVLGKSDVPLRALAQSDRKPSTTTLEILHIMPRRAQTKKGQAASLPGKLWEASPSCKHQQSGSLQSHQLGNPGQNETDWRKRSVLNLWIWMISPCSGLWFW